MTKFCAILFYIQSFICNINAQVLTKISIDNLTKELEQNDDTLRITNLWATWCKPCVEELPHFLALSKAYKTSGIKVKFILLAVEDKYETVRTFLTKKMMPLDNFACLDDKDANHWIPKIDLEWQGELPVSLFIQTQNKIREFHKGVLTKDILQNKIENYIKKN